MSHRRSIVNSDMDKAVTVRSEASKSGYSRRRKTRSSGRRDSRRRSYSGSGSGSESRSLSRSRRDSTSRGRSIASGRSSSRDSKVSRRSSSKGRRREDSREDKDRRRDRKRDEERSGSRRSRSESERRNRRRRSRDREEKREREEIVMPPKLDKKRYEELLEDDPDRFGRQGFDTLNEEVMKTVVKDMKNAMDSRPSEDTYHPTPKGMNIELMRHQKHGLAWMLWRERQTSPGGILADDMGLGKTLLTISLILQQKIQRLARKKAGKDDYDRAKREVEKKMELVPWNTTLVVAPASVIHQWEAEIRRRLKKDTLKVLMLSGDKKSREDDPKKLAEADVVITTSALVSREFALLSQVAFERIVLDEAHSIKNKATEGSKVICRLGAGSHWCLTGTPVHNDLWDLYSLVRFMRISPFDMEDYWKEYIESGEGKAQCANRLNVLTRSILLRRTKDQMDPVTKKPLVELPPKERSTKSCLWPLSKPPSQKKSYRNLRLQVKKMLEEANQDDEGEDIKKKKKRRSQANAPNSFSLNVSGKNRTSCVLVMLLRLRQACVHMFLTKEAVDMSAFDTLEADEDDLLKNAMGKLTLEDPTKAEDVFQSDYMSCKMKKLMEIVEEVEEAGEKIVIVSQWATLLGLVSDRLSQKDGRVTSITGSVPTDKRQERIDSFNQEGGGASAMLLSLAAGGVGLNLIGGNHLVMLDLHWNPALEAQACDRIYRVGQKRPVHIHRLIITGSIEQRVLELQENKKNLAEGVLTGAASKKTTQLSSHDIEYLFNIGRH